MFYQLILLCKSLKKNCHSEGGKRIPEAGWKQINSKNLNDPKNKEELVNFLINYGYRSSEMCDNASDIKNKKDCKGAITETIRLILFKSGDALIPKEISKNMRG